MFQRRNTEHILLGFHTSTGGWALPLSTSFPGWLNPFAQKVGGMGEGEQAFLQISFRQLLPDRKLYWKTFLSLYKTINFLICKVKPESYSHKFVLKSTFLLALSKRNLHTAGSTVRFFGLSSKSSFCHSSLTSSLLVPGWKASQKICWEMGRATADLCKSNFFKARANRRVPTLCIAETYDAIQGMNSPWCNLILNPVFLLCVRGWRRQSVVQVTESRHNQVLQSV